MNNSLNISLLEGRLTRDPQLIAVGSNELCKFNIAVNSSYKNGEAFKDSVDFFSITAWDKLANPCSKYLKKGSKVRVRGRLKQENWTSPEGRKMSKILIDASKVDFLSNNFRKEEKAIATQTEPMLDTVPF